MALHGRAEARTRTAASHSRFCCVKYKRRCFVNVADLECSAHEVANAAPASALPVRGIHCAQQCRSRICPCGVPVAGTYIWRRGGCTFCRVPSAKPLERNRLPICDIDLLVRGPTRHQILNQGFLLGVGLRSQVSPIHLAGVVAPLATRRHRRAATGLHLLQPARLRPGLLQQGHALVRRHANRCTLRVSRLLLSVQWHAWWREVCACALLTVLRRAVCGRLGKGTGTRLHDRLRKGVGLRHDRLRKGSGLLHLNWMWPGARCVNKLLPGLPLPNLRCDWLRKRIRLRNGFCWCAMGLETRML